MPLDFPPFPAPPPPMDIPDNILHEDEEEALANMLMSSYMNGYHTGYYQVRASLYSTFFSRNGCLN